MLYQHIYGDDAVTMGIFLLPPQARLPLHDHPEMTVIISCALLLTPSQVFSKLLFGELETVSFTWEQGI